MFCFIATEMLAKNIKKIFEKTCFDDLPIQSPNTVVFAFKPLSSSLSSKNVLPI